MTGRIKMGGWVKKYRSIPVTVRISLLFTICGFLQKAVSVIVVPIYTRLMPSEAYGQYSVFFSWYQLLMIFTTLNMWNYLINNGMTDFSGHKWEFISALQGLAGVITIAWFLIYIPFSGRWEQATGLTVPMMAVMFLEFLTMPSYEYWCAVKRFHYDVKGVVLTTVLITVLTPAVTIPAILLSDNKSLAAIIGKCAVPIMVYIFVACNLLRKGHSLYNKQYWKYALNFNLPLIPHFLSMILLQSFDKIMIERMCGASDAAIYSVAYHAAGVLSIFNSALLNVFVPYTYRALKEGREKEIGKKAVPLVIFIGLVNFAVVMFAPEVIGILAPEEYQAAIYVIPPVAMSNLLMFLFNLFANIEYYFKKTKLVAAASVSSAAANVVLNYIFIQLYGFTAAGYTTVFCYALFSLCHYIFMRKVTRKYLDGRKVYDTKKIVLIVGGFLTVSILSVKLYQERFIFIRYGILVIMAIVGMIKRKEIISMVYGKQ